MRNALRRFALAALIAPAAIGAALMIASPAEAAPKASEVSLQAEINRLVDVERTANGCAALTVNDQLTTAARNHSGWMAQTGEFSHTGKAGSDFFARVAEAGYAKPAAENIAWGYRSAEQVVASWMKSPGHRANILNCANTTVGVGAVYAESGTPYYTQNFGS